MARRLQEDDDAEPLHQRAKENDGRSGRTLAVEAVSRALSGREDNGRIRQPL